MAWTEQCRIHFHHNVENLVGKQKKKNITAAIKQLHKDSGIPFTTLRDWYYEEKRKIENDLNPDRSETTTTQIDNNNNTIKTQLIVGNQIIERNICIRCEKNPIDIQRKTKKPSTKNSMYYGLCRKCREYQKKITEIDKAADKENRILTFCPSCNKPHYIDKKRI